MFLFLQLYIDIPLYIEDPSLSRISISVQKQPWDIHAIVQNLNIEDSGNEYIPQEIETFSRSFYLTITSESDINTDFTPPGITILIFDVS